MTRLSFGQSNAIIDYGEHCSSGLLAFNEIEPYYVANLDQDGRLFVSDIENGVCLPVLSERFAHIEARGAGWVGLTKENELCEIKPGPSLQLLAWSHVDQTVMAFALAQSGDSGVLVNDADELFALDMKSLSLTPIGTADLVLKKGEGWENRLAVSPDGSRIAIAREDGRISLIASGSGTATTIETGLEEVRISFVHQGRTLLVTGAEAFQFWEVETQTPLVRFGTGSAIGAPVIAAASPDGCFFVWGTLGEYALHVMNGRATQELCLLPQDESQQFRGSLAFSPDGRCLAVDDGAGGVNLWSFAREDWIAVARELSNRNISRDEWKRFMPDTEYPASTDAAPVRTPQVIITSATQMPIQVPAIKDVKATSGALIESQAVNDWVAQHEIAMPPAHNPPDRSPEPASPTIPASGQVVLSDPLDPLILGVAIGLMTALCWFSVSGSFSKQSADGSSALALWALYLPLALFTRYRYHRWIARPQPGLLLLRRCVWGTSILLLCVSIWGLTTIAGGLISTRSIALALAGAYVATMAWNVGYLLTRPDVRQALISGSSSTSRPLLEAVKKIVSSQPILTKLWLDISLAGMLTAAVLWFASLW
jgi:WD40 repeat protein